MTDPLLDLILANPEDDTPRLIWADREGGLAGDLVIVQCQLEARDLPRAERWRLKQLERGLLERRHKVEELVTGLRPEWHRGFAYAISLEQRELLERSARIVERYPLISEISTFLQAFGQDTSAEGSWKALEEPLARALAFFPHLRRFDGKAVAHDTRYREMPDLDALDFPPAVDCSDGLLEVLARAAPNLVTIELQGEPTARGLELLASFPKLEALYLSETALRFEDVPDLLRKLPTLTRLGLRAESDVRALTQASECQRLTHLSLFEPLDRGSIVELAKMTTLTALSVRTSEAFPAAAFTNQPLEQLELHAPLTNEDIAILARGKIASHLRALILRGERLTNDAIPDLLSFPNLERLYLLSSDIALDSLEAVIPDVQSA